MFDAASHDGTLLTTQGFFGTDGAGTCKLQPFRQTSAIVCLGRSTDPGTGTENQEVEVGQNSLIPEIPSPRPTHRKCNTWSKGLHFPSIQLCQAPASAYTGTPGAIARAEVASKSPRQSGLGVLRASRCRFRICIPVPCGLRRLACFIAG